MVITIKEQNFQLYTAENEDSSNQIIDFPLRIPQPLNSRNSSQKQQPFIGRKDAKDQVLDFALKSMKNVLSDNLIFFFQDLLKGNEQELENGNEEEGLTLFEWHPFKTCVTFIHSRSALYLYSFTSKAWLPSSNTGLRHELQTNVTCLAWCPFASITLAVGSRNGVLLWRFANDPRSGLREPLAQGVMPLFTSNPQTHPHPWVQTLVVPGLENVSCLQWSPCGRWLVAGYKSKASIVVWDSKDWGHTVLTGQPWGGGSKKLAFHPDGDWLAQVTTGSSIVVWETHTWDMAKFTTLSECTSLCWIPNSKIFIFSILNSNKIHMLQMKTDSPNLDVTNAPSLKLPPLVDTSIPASQQPERSELTIRKIYLDPTGNRLAVTFFGLADRIGLYAIVMRPLPELVPIGWVYGGGGQEADEDRLPTVSWGNKIKHGALMGIQWTLTQFTYISLKF